VTFLLFFLCCLAYFGGPVKDGIRSDTQLACEVALFFWDSRSGQVPIATRTAGSKG
jgi:hypothetical protein